MNCSLSTLMAYKWLNLILTLYFRSKEECQRIRAAPCRFLIRFVSSGIPVTFVTTWLYARFSLLLRNDSYSCQFQNNKVNTKAEISASQYARFLTFLLLLLVISNFKQLFSSVIVVTCVLLFFFFQIQESLIECTKQQNLELRFCQELATAVTQKASSLAGRDVLLTC